MKWGDTVTPDADIKISKLKPKRCWECRYYLFDIDKTKCMMGEADEVGVCRYYIAKENTNKVTLDLARNLAERELESLVRAIGIEGAFPESQREAVMNRIVALEGVLSKESK